MKVITSSLTLVLALGLLCHADPAGAQTSGLDSRLAGTWRLVSTEATLPDGTKGPIPWLGPQGKAYLIYTADRHMCVALMNPQRPMWSSSDTPSEKEAKSAVDGFYAYCSAVEVNDKEAIVTHHVEIALAPNDVGEAFKRRFRFEGNRLILQPMEESGTSLTWERVR